MSIPLGIFGAARPPRTPPGGLLSAQAVASALSATSGKTHTFQGVALGDPAADRVIVLGIGRRAKSTGLTVTVAGVPVVIDALHQWSTVHSVVIGHAHVPAGAAGDIVMTAPSYASAASVGVWRMVGHASPVVTGTDVGSTNSGTLAPAAGDIGFAVGIANSSSANIVFAPAADYFEATSAVAMSTTGGRFDGSLVYGNNAGTLYSAAVRYGRP